MQHVSLDEAVDAGPTAREDIVALDDALLELTRLDQRKAQVVELRFFGGLSVEETGAVLDISPVTVMREWSSAKAWLYRKMNGGLSREP